MPINWSAIELRRYVIAERRDFAFGELRTINSNTAQVELRSEPAAPSGASILAQVGRGAGALGLGTLIGIVGQLAVVPVAMRSWGPARWGEWSVLAAFTTLLAMSDLGMQSFVANRMCAAWATRNRQALLGNLSSALKVDVPLVSALFLILAAAVWAVPLPRLLGLRTVGAIELRLVILLLVIEPLLGVPMGVATSVYRATGHLAWGAMTGNVRQVAMLAVTLAALVLDFRFLWIAGGRAAVAAAISAWILYDLRRLFPWLHANLRVGNWREGAAMIVPGLFFLMIPFANYLGNEFLLMVIQRALGGSAVSRYATHRTAVNFARTMSAMMTIAAWPELTALHARGELNRLAQAHRSLAKWNFWLVGGVTGSVVILLPVLYGPWTAGRLTLDQRTLALLALRVALWGLWSGSMTLLLSINRQRPVAIALACAATLAGALSIVLVPRLGIAGAALALLAGDLCLPAWMIPFFACRATGERPREFLRAASIAPALSLTVALAVVFAGRRYLRNPSLGYAVVFPAGAAAATALMWLLLSPAERRFAEGFGRKAMATTTSLLFRD